MYSDEVYTHLKYLPVNNIGVYASDCLPRYIPRSSAIVVNTDPHTKRGTHWIAIFLDAHGKLDYFDSFGQPPTVRTHIEFVRRNSQQYFYNPQQCQSLTSAMCGHYCLTFLYFRSHAFSMKEFVSMFTNDVNKNDKLVKHAFHYLYN